jgi:hypothetical protein
MWITAHFPVTHISTASAAGAGPIISHIFHLALLAADGVDRQLGLVDARGDCSLVCEALLKDWSRSHLKVAGMGFELAGGG